jgi:AcrR family transcriptional regulator
VSSLTPNPLDYPRCSSQEGVITLAKPRQARLTAAEVGLLQELDDESPNLWPADLNEVARKLLTSAVRCFASNGFHGTTTRDIPGMVGLSPAALYVYFPSKEQVLFELIRTGHEKALDYVRAPEIQHLGDAAERLRVIVSRYTEWHARHHVIARVCQYDLASLSVEHYNDILELRHQTNAVFRGAVQQGVDDGTFATIDVNRVARAMLSLGIDLVRWYRRDGSETPEQLGRFNADLALKMVR